MRTPSISQAHSKEKADGTNPEELFALGWSACFLSSIERIATHGANVTIPANAAVSVTIGVGPRSEGGFGITAATTVSLPGMDQPVVQALVEKAKAPCPYSNATRGNIDMQVSIM